MAYIDYAKRRVLGLGCSTDGDILGLLANKSDTPMTGTTVNVLGIKTSKLLTLRIYG